MRARRAVALAAALALACPGAAGASQALTRTYQVGEQVPATIEVAGVEYALASASSRSPITTISISTNTVS